MLDGWVKKSCASVSECLFEIFTNNLKVLIFEETFEMMSMFYLFGLNFADSLSARYYSQFILFAVTTS